MVSLYKREVELPWHLTFSCSFSGQDGQLTLGNQAITLFMKYEFLKGLMLPQVGAVEGLGMGRKANRTPLFIQNVGIKGCIRYPTVLGSGREFAGGCNILRNKPGL